MTKEKSSIQSCGDSCGQKCRCKLQLDMSDPNHRTYLHAWKGKEWEGKHQSHPAELGVAGEYAPGESAVFMKQAEWPNYSLWSLIFHKIILYRLLWRNKKKTCLDDWLAIQIYWALLSKYIGHFAVNWLFWSVGIRPVWEGLHWLLGQEGPVSIMHCDVLGLSCKKRLFSLQLLIYIIALKCRRKD